MNSLHWLAPSNNPHETTFRTVMTRNATNIPISPAKTIISIISSGSTSDDHGNDTQVHKKTDSALANASDSLPPVAPSPLVKNLLDNLSVDISEIIRSKDNTIESLFIECEIARTNALKAENLHLQEKAKLLQRAGYDNAKSTARILELHLKIKKVEVQKESLAFSSQAESFQLKKDIIDLRAWKSEAESIVDGLHMKIREAKSDFEKQLAAKNNLMEQAKMEAVEGGKVLEAKDKKVKDLSNEVTELNRENNELLSELQDLKTRMGGYKRTGEQFKEGMDESLWVDEHRGQKASVVEH
ncbi:hypothetical protein DL98DRAFT_540465 [Cadophora sp. DSE1049]|nr:hypothetical protein DL98DRAFT_540465 [Cadophora sp. DSE1049]